MQQRFFLIIALVCLTFLGCKESSRSDFRPVATSIEKKRFAPKTAADEKVYPKKNTDSLREESKAKTIVVDATIKRFNNLWRGKDAYTDMSQHNVEEGSTITKHYEK